MYAANKRGFFFTKITGSNLKIYGKVKRSLYLKTDLQGLDPLTFNIAMAALLYHLKIVVILLKTQ